MKVINLGRGGIAIEPESTADSVQTLSPARLRLGNVSEEAIKIYESYLERTSVLAKRNVSTGDS